MLKIVGLACLVVGSMCGIANAADLTKPVPSESDWQFIVAPYSWAMGVSGDVNVGRLPTANLDVNFSDILDALDAPPIMIVGEARNGRFSLSGDLIWAKLVDQVSTPDGIFADHVVGSLELTSLTGLGGYSLLYGDAGNLDIVAGARMWSIDTGLKLKGGQLAGVSGSASSTWVDPVVGLKGRADIATNVFVTGWALIGGFDVSDDKLMWDVMGSVGYDFSDHFSMTVGYRGMGLDYRKKQSIS